MIAQRSANIGLHSEPPPLPGTLPLSACRDHDGEIEAATACYFKLIHFSVSSMTEGTLRYRATSQEAAAQIEVSPTSHVRPRSPLLAEPGLEFRMYHHPSHPFDPLKRPEHILGQLELCSR